MNPTEIQTFVQQQVKADKKARPDRQAKEQRRIEAEQERVTERLKKKIARYAPDGDWTSINIKVRLSSAMNANFLSLWDTPDWQLNFSQYQSFWHRGKVVYKKKSLQGRSVGK